MFKIQASITSITPFNADIGTTISFRWDGNMVFKNRCIIKDNKTNATIYDNIVEGFENKHTLDLSKFTTPLQNGNWYLAYIIVYDRYGNVSDIQNTGIVFLCLKTPVFDFTNIPQENTLTTSTQTLSLMYQQENHEPLNEWAITIYSSSRTKVSSSGTKYGTDILDYTFSGFVNNSDYYIRAEGKTLNGMSVDTGYVYIKVRYDTNGIFSLLQPVNVSEKGAIDVKCNIISAEGELQKNGVYIDGHYLDLRNNVLIYDRGFALQKNFSLAIVFYGAKFNQCIETFSSMNMDDLSASVICRVGCFETSNAQVCYELNVQSRGIATTIFSNKINIPSVDDRIGVLVTRKDGLYHIEIQNLGKAGG